MDLKQLQRSLEHAAGSGGAASARDTEADGTAELTRRGEMQAPPGLAELAPDATPAPGLSAGDVAHEQAARAARRGAEVAVGRTR